jgi:hypothetical protein
LQHSRLVGLTPAGVDLAVPGAAPAKELLVPGIVAMPTTVDSAFPSVFRLLAPGQRDARATVEFLGEDGPVELPGAEDIALRAGEVVDIALLGLPEGAYTARVTSDQPVVAAALSSRFGATEDTPREFAWSPSGAAARTGFIPVFAATAFVVAGGPEEVELTAQAVHDDGTLGQAVTVSIPAGQVRRIAPSDLGITPAGAPADPAAAGSGDAAADPDAADPSAADPNAADPNAADPNAADPSAADPNAADPNAADPNAAGSGESAPESGAAGPDAAQSGAAAGSAGAAGAIGFRYSLRGGAAGLAAIQLSGQGQRIAVLTPTDSAPARSQVTVKPEEP